MNTYFELKKLVEELQDDVTKVYTKNNKGYKVLGGGWIVG